MINTLLTERIHLSDLVPEPYETWIDVNLGIFIVSINIDKVVYDTLLPKDVFNKFINKPFSDLHENILYGNGSISCANLSYMTFTNEYDILGNIDIDNVIDYSIFNKYNIEINETKPNNEFSKLIYEENNGKYSLILAYDVVSCDWTALVEDITPIETTPEVIKEINVN